MLSYNLYAKYGRATYVRSTLVDCMEVSSHPFCDIVQVGGLHIANIYKPPSENWSPTTLPPVLPHAAIYIGDSNSHHQDWGYDTANNDGDQLQLWAAGENLHLIHNAKQQGTFHSARWLKDSSPSASAVGKIYVPTGFHSLQPEKLVHNPSTRGSLNRSLNSVMPQSKQIR